MPLPDRLRQLQPHSRLRLTIQQSTLRGGLTLILAAACISCAGSTDSAATQEEWRDNGTAERRSGALLPPANVGKSSESGGLLGIDYSQMTAGSDQLNVQQTNDKVTKTPSVSRSSTTKQPFQLPSVPVDRRNHAVPLVDRGF